MVTMGQPQQAAEFRRRYRLPFVMLCDPQREAYRAYHLPRGTWWQIAGPKVWLLGAWSVLRRGAGRRIGDPRQMPGTFVIARGGMVAWVHRPRHQADLPSHEQMLEMLRRLANDPEHSGPKTVSA